MDADVIVIGAGAAGLAAAQRLAERSLRVLLIEARGRVGGRVWSRPPPGSATPAELGAEFIHGPAEETFELLRDAGLRAVNVGRESWVCAGRELRRDDLDFTSAAAVFEGARRLPQDESVDQFLRRFDGDAGERDVAKAARNFVEGFEAADPALASARAIADEWLTGVDSRTARPIGGYAPVFHRMREACTAAGVRIVLSTSARSVAWGRGEVAIKVAGSRGEPGTLRARAAVVTLPVGVLRHRGDETAVEFEPELPRAKRESLARVEMGRAVKVALAFRGGFWERVRGGRYRNAEFFHCDAQPFPAYWTQTPVRSELVVAWAGGPRATALSGASQAELVERAVNGLGMMLGDPSVTRAEFTGGLTHDWSADAFSRGAYSYVAVGGGDARAVLAAPLDAALFFAGEATSTDGQGGTVNGALKTGRRAADEVAAALA
jgi:monoamine oxidase